MIRAENLNERYYALSNEPNLSHIKKHYQFEDRKGRLYMLAEKNRQIFQNERLAYREHRHRGRATCDTNHAGYIKFYVGLSDPSVQWFGARDINHDITLFPRHTIPPTTTTTTTTNSSVRPLLVTLKTTFKPSQKKRRGTIHVRGISREQCDELLNKD